MYSAYLKSDESRKDKYAVTFFTRADKYAVGKDFIRGDRSLNLNLQTMLEGNAKRQFYLNATFRKLKVLNNTVSTQKEDETILGRAEYVMNEWKGLLTGNVLYTKWEQGRSNAGTLPIWKCLQVPGNMPGMIITVIISSS